jgi:diguanylate cyclase (GGDEF)-like protein
MTSVTNDDSIADPASPEARPAAATRLRRWLSVATDAHVLFPALAVILLAVIWGTTLNLIRVERTAAEFAAAASSHELAETYEAQVVRALREIDQTLKFVKYASDAKGGRIALQQLKSMGLLPADLLFIVSITDSRGDVVASTRALEISNVADRDYFVSQREGDSISVGLPLRNSISGEWKLQFSRRLTAADGTFSGIVMVSVDAAYFVSGYEQSKLGEHGVLGIIGHDGVFRARRTGDSVFAGGAVDYATVVPPVDAPDHVAKISTNPWDGVRRYTSARQLFDFPLAVIVGLSAEEKLAAVRADERAYLWRATAGSLLLIAVIAVLGRMSRQLSQGRLHAIEEQVAHAKQVEYIAYHDALTGLPNRGLFSKVLGESIKQASRYDRHLAVLFLDLDRFKHINDTLGHEAGDQLLREVAARLKACLRDSDTVARLGGDEFVVLLPELSDERYVGTVAQKILAGVGRPFLLLGQEFRVTTSLGVSVYPVDGLDEQTLTKNADIAMYHAKAEGRNKFRFYSEELNANSLERLTLESSLRHALEQNQFQLHYQTKQDIRSGQITGMEALLRWQHPDLGVVAPLQFISVAEETGLIVPIGNWVLRTACRQNVAWQEQGLPHLRMAVNLTPRQFQDERLISDLTAILHETGMDPQLLELEISESLLMRDVEKTLGILTQLKDMGIRIAIDDFGTGYSSLSTLKQFPLDTIKIDRSFIRDVAHVAEDNDLTEAIVAMGRTLSLTVVAQGVETKEQADFIRRNACDEFQGFYFNRPLPADLIAELLRSRAEAHSENSTLTL